jgi:hypothetical protein
MCVYHGENYLAAAIQSILDQTLENYEFLIIDERWRAFRHPTCQRVRTSS